MFSVIVIFWALCILCLINMMRYFSSIRVLLTILRQSDPLLYQSVDGNGFFTMHGQFSKQLRLIRYINQRGTVAKLAMRQPFVLFKGLTFQKLCLPGA
ncbi:hypothetical protein NFG07_05795, partial [Proteus mirabilis]|nr:hypothetical protein [Proteus mirabilis]